MLDEQLDQDAAESVVKVRIEIDRGGVSASRRTESDG